MKGDLERLFNRKWFVYLLTFTLVAVCLKLGVFLGSQPWGLEFASWWVVIWGSTFLADQFWKSLHQDAQKTVEPAAQHTDPIDNSRPHLKSPASGSKYQPDESLQRENSLLRFLIMALIGLLSIAVSYMKKP